MNREKIDTRSEDQILTGMIVSTEFLRLVRPLAGAGLWAGGFHDDVSRWCLDHYMEFHCAPGRHIQDVFNKKEPTLEEAQANLITKFLERISGEYERAEVPDPNYLLAQAERYFKRRKQEGLSEDLKFAIAESDNPEDIDDLVREYSDQKIDLLGRGFSESLFTSAELMAARIKLPTAFLYPWLREGSLNMIYADRGRGKSWLAMLIGVVLTRDNYRDLDIGSWYVKNQSGVLYVDGEMGAFDLQDRLRQIATPLGKESRRFPLMTFSAPDYTEKYHETVNLHLIVWQDRIINYLLNNRSIRTVILDNLSSLCAGRDENDNQIATRFNLWLIRLRAIGVAVIIVHHAGKSGAQRGASSQEDPLNNVIRLFKPKDAVPGTGAHFGVEFTKARNDPGGDDYRTFSLRIMEHDDNPRWRQWAEL